MNILFVNKVSPRLGGGAELRLREIGKRLVNRGHAVHVICAKTQPGLPDSEVIDGIRVHYLRLLPEFLFRFERMAFHLSRYAFYPATLFLGRRIRQLAPDIIVDYVAPAPGFAFWHAKHLRLASCAEVMEYRGKRWFQIANPVTAVLGVIAQSVLRRLSFDKIIAISEFTRGELERAGCRSRTLTTVPCGIDCAPFKHQALGDRNDNTLVYVARLVRSKGHRHLFDALALVKSEIPTVRLYVVGDGPLRIPLEAYVSRKKLGMNVIFTGRQSEPDKISLLSASSVFVAPSLQEGFGLVLLEAMACGLPIIAFDLPVYREFMDANSGYTVDLGDTQAMAEKILFLLRNRDVREQMSTYNLQHVQRFDWDRIAEAEESALAELVVR